MVWLRVLVGRSLLLATLLPVAGCITCMLPPEQSTVAYFRTPGRLHRTPVFSNWKSLKEMNVVMQRRDYSCGPASLATVVRYYWGDDVSEEAFLVAAIRAMTEEEFQDRRENGLSMTDLRRSAVALGYFASIGRVSMDELSESKIPVVLRIELNDFDHFVVYRGIVDDRVYLADPIRGNLRLSVEEFLQQWADGAILVVVKKGVDPPEDAPLSRLPPPRAQGELEAARRFVSRNF